MSNGNVIGKFSDEIEQTAGEVAQDAKDQVGEAIEQGMQSAFGPQLTPQQQQEQQKEAQQKEVDKQKQLNYTRKWLSDLAVAQEKVRAENKQKEQQRLQVEEQEKQVTEMKKEEKKKKPVDSNLTYAGKAEIKRGVGG